MLKNIKKLFGFFLMLSTCYSPTELPQDEVQLPTAEEPYFVISRVSEGTFRGKHIVESVKYCGRVEFEADKDGRLTFDAEVGQRLLLSNLVGYELSYIKDRGKEGEKEIDVLGPIKNTKDEIKAIEKFISEHPELTQADQDPVA